MRTSTKNVAQEVVSSLIPPQGGLGVLADVQQTDLSQWRTADDTQTQANGGVLAASAQSLQRRNMGVSSAQPRIAGSANSASNTFEQPDDNMN